MSQSQSASTGLQRLVGFIGEHQLAAVIILILLFAFVSTDWSLAGFIIMYSLFAIGYNFALGRTGILTFGHAAFFGIGAYGYGLIVFHGDITGYAIWLAVLAALGLAALAGLVIGALVLRLGGTYLALVTLAIAQALWFLAYVVRGVTGGDDGLIGVARPPVEIPGVFDVNLANPQMFVYFSLVFLIISLGILLYIGRSNFGQVLVAIRENENRATFLGYNTYRYKLAAFSISALFSGLAGILYPILLGVVSPATLFWMLSGEVNFWVLLGGIGTLVGPIIGTGIYLILREWISAATEIWRIPVGAIIIFMVLYAPEGILPKVRNILEGN